MGRIWSQENKLNNWLKIDIAACEGWTVVGKIPATDLEKIKSKANYNLRRCKEKRLRNRRFFIARGELL
jgi:adenylosuccinate lyase